MNVDRNAPRFMEVCPERTLIFPHLSIVCRRLQETICTIRSSNAG